MKLIRPVLAVSAVLLASIPACAASPSLTATATGRKVSATVLAEGASRAGADLMVREVEIEGTINVKPSDLAQLLRTRIGVQLTSETLRDDIKAIWNMGSFDDIVVDATPVEGGYRLTFIVKERPTVKEVKFRNSKEFGEKDLKERVSLQAGDFYDPARGHEAEVAIQQAYREKGYPDAVVTAVLEPVEKEKGKVDVVLDVKEGTKFHVRKVTFEGNHLFPESALKKVLKNKEAMFFFQSGTYMKDEVARDEGRLVDFYKNEGYLKARVVKSEVMDVIKKDGKEKEKDAVDLKFTLVEGKLYSLKSASFQGATLIPDKELREKLDLKVGEKLSQRRLDEGIQRIREVYTDRGYIYAVILPDMQFDDEKATTDLTLRFHEGGVAYIDRILVRGNEETKEKVIMREVVVQSGKVFETERIRRSQERIYNLGFFEDVKVYTEPSLEAGKENLVFEVKERQTGTVSLGGGYSSQYGFVGFLQLTKLNLFGLGIRIGAEWEFGQKRRNISLDYYDPYFWDSPVSLGLGFWDTDRDLPNTYTQKSTGGSVSFGWRPAENLRVTLAYKYEVDDVDPIGDINRDGVENAADLPAGVSDDPLTTSSPSLTVNWDTRDNIFDPMRGNSHQLFMQVAGGPYPEGGVNFLGGDTKFYKVLYDASYFKPSPIRVPLVGRPSLGLHMRTGRAWGAGGQDVPIFERFFLGGTDSIRGYGERIIGPIDPVTTQPAGGSAMWQFNAEVKWPVVPRIVTIAAPFFDIGNAWSSFSPFSLSKFKEEAKILPYSVGLGLRLTIPGTIIVVRVDYGWPLSDAYISRYREVNPNERIDKSGRFHFNIGNIF